MGLEDDVYTNASRIIILKLEEKGELGLIVDEVCEVGTLMFVSMKLKNQTLMLRQYRKGSVYKRDRQKWRRTYLII